MSAPEEKAMGHVEVNVFRKSLLKVQSSAVKGFLKVVSFTWKETCKELKQKKKFVIWFCDV